MRNVTPEQVAMAEQHRRGELPDRIEGALGSKAEIRGSKHTTPTARTPRGQPARYTLIQSRRVTSAAMRTIADSTISAHTIRP